MKTLDEMGITRDQSSQWQKLAVASNQFPPKLMNCRDNARQSNPNKGGLVLSAIRAVWGEAAPSPQRKGAANAQQTVVAAPVISQRYSSDLDQRKSSVPARIWSAHPAGTAHYDRPPTLDLWNWPERVVGYPDTVWVSVPHRPSDGEMHRLRERYGQRAARRARIKGVPDFASYKWRISIQRPTQATIDDLCSRLGGYVYRYDFAVDLLGPADAMRTNALIIDALGCQQYRSSHSIRSVRKGEAVGYWAQRDAARNVALYANRASKTGMGDPDGCCHIELRFIGAEAVRTAQACLAKHGIIGLLSRELVMRQLNQRKLDRIVLDDRALRRRLGPEASRETIRQYAAQDVLDHIHELHDAFATVARWTDLVPVPERLDGGFIMSKPTPRIVDRTVVAQTLPTTPTESYIPGSRLNHANPTPSAPTLTAPEPSPARSSPSPITAAVIGYGERQHTLFIPFSRLLLTRLEEDGNAPRLQPPRLRLQQTFVSSSPHLE